MGNNNKESYELLARFTSGSESEIPEVLIPSKKKKFRRKRRVNASKNDDMISVDKLCSSKGPGGNLLVAIITCSALLVWVIALTWLAFVLNAEIQRLDKTVQSGELTGGESMTMDSTRVSVPLRVGGKKMRKRKELDALAGGGKRGGKRGSGDQLLSESTDEEMWGGGGGGVRGGGRAGRYLLRRRTCASMLRACTALLVLACVLATTTVMWLFIDVREQATYLRSQLDQVVAGNQGVPDTLQKCHSISRELQKNQTELFNRITSLTQQIAAFNTQVSIVNSGLNKVEKQLKASPELVNVASLSSSVASFGSQIQDLVSTTKQLKETNTRLDETSHALELNITSLKQKISEMKSTSLSPTEVPDSNALAALSSLVNSLRSNLTNINNTLSSKLQWSSEDELRDSKSIQSLQDMNANLSARVTTLESKSNSKDLKTLQENFDQFSLKIEGRFSDMSNKLTGLQDKCSKLENNTAHLESTVNNMRLSYSIEPSTATTILDAVAQPSEKLKPSNVTEP